MFRQFDVDYDKITIDGVVVGKPSYFSIKGWLDFWDQFNEEVIEERIAKAYDEGVKEGDHEHEQDIDGIKELCFKQLAKIANESRCALDNDDLSNNEKYDKIVDAIDSANDEVRRYG